MKAFPGSGVGFMLASGGVVVMGMGAGKARRAGVLTGACARKKYFDSALESECERRRERERELERPKGLLLVPNASASIDRVEGSLVRLLTKVNCPFGSHSIHVLPEPASIEVRVDDGGG
jgi:hypothetical protein